MIEVLDVNRLLVKLYSLIIIFSLSACGGGGDIASPPANLAPTISGTPPVLVNIGIVYDFTPDAQDADGDTLTFSVNNKPDWLQLDSATGNLTGTPTDQDAQNYSTIKIIATDPSGATASLPDFDLLVNSAPVIVTNTQLSYIEGSDATLSALNSSDVDGHVFTYVWEQTDGPTINIDDPYLSSITLSMPLVDASTNVSLTLTLTDEYGAVSREDLVFAITTDDSAPTVKSFVFFVSGEPTEATLAWLPAVDNATPAYKIQYRLYASALEFFTPDASTLKGSYQGEISATVTGLTVDTLYYFKLVAIDAAGNETMQANYANLTTASVSAVPSGEIVNEATKLNLGALDISGANNDVYAFAVNENTVEPEIGSFLIGEDANGEGYLRKVESVDNNQTTLTLETSQASFTDVLETASFSTTTHLRSVADEQVAINKLRSQQSSQSNVSVVNPSAIWKEQLLSITESGAIPQTSNRKLKSPAANSTQRLKSTPFVLTPNASVKLTGDFFFEPVVKSDIHWSFFSVDRYEADVSGHFSFDGSIEFNYKAAAPEVDELIQVFTRTFTSRYIIGGVPVYQDTILTLSAQFQVNEAKIAIAAKVDNHLSAEVSFNTVYENGVWTNTPISGFNKSLTATATVKGNVLAEIRLIPEVKLRFYKIASVAVSVEPFLTGELAVEAVTQVDLIGEGPGLLSEYGFTKFDSSIGVDVNFYTDLTILKKTIARYPATGSNNLYTNNWQLFGLPKLEITTDKKNPPSIYSPMTLTGQTTPYTNSFGDTNPIDPNSLRWATFPDISNGAGATFNWQPDKHGEIFSVYFIGNSTKLGDIGQQFLVQEIDMRDTDADGMPNAWEDFYKFNAISAADAGTDWDEDGVTNLDEYIASTNPKDAICDFFYAEYYADNTRVLDSDIGEYEGTTDTSVPGYTVKSYFTPHQTRDGTWKGYLSKREVFINGEIERREIYESFKDEACLVISEQARTIYTVDGRDEMLFGAYKNDNGVWNPVLEGFFKQYYNSGRIKQITHQTAYKFSNGIWYYVSDGFHESYYDNNGQDGLPQLSRRGPVVVKEIIGWGWTGVTEGLVESWYQSGALFRSQNFIGKLETWADIWGSYSVGVIDYFENGRVSVDNPKVVIQDSSGNWSSVTHGTVYIYYCDGALRSSSVYEYGVFISSWSSDTSVDHPCTPP